MNDEWIWCIFWIWQYSWLWVWLWRSFISFRSEFIESELIESEFTVDELRHEFRSFRSWIWVIKEQVLGDLHDLYLNTLSRSPRFKATAKWLSSNRWPLSILSNLKHGKPSRTLPAAKKVIPTKNETDIIYTNNRAIDEEVEVSLTCGGGL